MKCCYWMVKYSFAALLLSWLFTGCQTEPVDGDYHFRLLKKASTGLDFENIPKQNLDFNVFSYMYFFNGGGLAAGDFNQDGLEDLFFTSNQGPNKLFLNEGELKFKDATATAGLAGQEGWTSGVSVVDINNDGLLDIYVSQVGDYASIIGSNQLYICTGLKDGIPVFEDQAEAYGLKLIGFSTQATFFDYDLDGDLDMFQLNHSLHQNGTFGQKKNFIGKQDPYSGDKLMRNDDGHFVEVTLDAGISSMVIGYGLGVACGDINLDGWPDLYISNDFHENDYLYINQQDGTFKDVLNEQMMHTSRFSMGVDIADINNDGWSEIFTLDMLPEDPFILKTSLGEDGYDIFQFKLGYGYNHQYARNTLQLNNRNNTFSEIGIFSGVAATDWSWAPLFLDFDHDGYKDLFISNGIPRRMNDIDYINFRTEDPNRKWKTENNFMKKEELSLVEKMPKIKLPNKFFRNTGQLKFEDQTDNVENSSTTFSNGAVYADLDNDGDLDVVVNNIEDEPFIYQNLLMDNEEVKGSYIDLTFQGPEKNRGAIGAKVLLYKGQEKLVYEHFPVKGYQSSVAPGLHIGVGEKSEVDSILLIWPDLSYEHLNTSIFNQSTTVEWKAGLPKFDFQRLRQQEKQAYEFKDITTEVGLNYTHKENSFVEFNRESLMPHMVSTEGPALAVGDLNGDGHEDVFIGGAKRQRSALFFQAGDGTFEERTPEAMALDSTYEDVDAVFADIENDGDLDLIVAAGGNEFSGKSDYLQQRVFINDGKGNFEKQLPFGETYLTASCVLAADVNGDGLIDLFFGGRAVPKKYGQTPTSYLFINKGNGQFEDATDSYSEELGLIGMVKEGCWSDIDQDGDPDLLLAVEWEALQLFVNEDGKLNRKAIDNHKGWWNFILPSDVDGDGDLDLLAGNLGKNSKLQPTLEEPLRLYVEDFDKNGQAEQILTYYLEGKEVPFANFAELTKQLNSLKKNYLLAKDFANASLSDLFGSKALQAAKTYEANTLQNAWFENTGQDLNFVMHELPNELQFAPLECAAALSTADFLLGGNFYECNIEMGRYDADFGHVLSIGKDKNMKAQTLGTLAIKGQLRRIAPIQIKGKACMILVRNNDDVMVLEK